MRFTAITITSIVICLVSCQEVNSKQTKSRDTSNLSSYDIDFLNSKIWLDTSYVSYTYDELYEIAKSEDNKAVNFILQLSEEYRNKKLKPIYFQHRLQPENIILLLPMPYHNMDKQTASIWISAMVASIKENDNLTGNTTKVIDKKIKKFSGHQMIKFKARQTFANKTKERFYHQYYISGNFKSFMTIHIDVNGDDIENQLKTLSLTSK